MKESFSFVKSSNWIIEKIWLKINDLFTNQTDVWKKSFRPVLWTESIDSLNTFDSKEWFVYKSIETNFVNWINWFIENIWLKLMICSHARFINKLFRPSLQLANYWKYLTHNNNLFKQICEQIIQISFGKWIKQFTEKIWLKKKSKKIFWIIGWILFQPDLMEKNITVLCFGKLVANW